jgi:hypothetical protein
MTENSPVKSLTQQRILRTNRGLGGGFVLDAVRDVSHEDRPLGFPITDTCGGGLEYFHRSLAIRRRRQNGNPVSNGSARYGLKFRGTWTREWQRWQGPLALVRVNLKPILSSERAALTKKQQISSDNFCGWEKKTGSWSQIVAWYHDTLTDWSSVVN